MGAVPPVPRVPARAAPHHLHDQRHQVAEYQLRKIIKKRGHFPNDDAVIKLLWLSIRDIEDKRARQRAAEAGKARNERKAPGHLVEGATVHHWKAALGALAIAYPDRLAGRI